MLKLFIKRTYQDQDDVPYVWEGGDVIQKQPTAAAGLSSCGDASSGSRLRVLELSANKVRKLNNSQESPAVKWKSKGPA